MVSCKLARQFMCICHRMMNILISLSASRMVSIYVCYGITTIVHTNASISYTLKEMKTATDKNSFPLYGLKVEESRVLVLVSPVP